MINSKIVLIIGLNLALVFSVFSQKDGSIESAEITVEKDRKVVLPQVEKPKETPTTIKPSANETKQMVFDIPERKVSVAAAKFNLNAQVYESKDISVNVYENFIKAGFGNYGRFYGEGLVNTPSSYLGVASLNFKHNTAF